MMELDGDGRASFTSPDGRFDLDVALLHHESSTTLSITTPLLHVHHPAGPSTRSAAAIMKKALELNYFLLATHRRDGDHRYTLAITPSRSTMQANDDDERSRLQVSLSSSHIIAGQGRDEIRIILERFVDNAGTLQAQLGGVGKESGPPSATHKSIQHPGPPLPTAPAPVRKIPSLFPGRKTAPASSSPWVDNEVGYQKEEVREMTPLDVYVVDPPRLLKNKRPDGPTSVVAVSPNKNLLPPPRRVRSSNSTPAPSSMSMSSNHKSFAKVPTHERQAPPLSAGEARLYETFRRKKEEQKREASVLAAEERRRKVMEPTPAEIEKERVVAYSKEFPEEFTPDLLHKKIKPVNHRTLKPLSAGSSSTPPPSPTKVPEGSGSSISIGTREGVETPLMSNKSLVVAAGGGSGGSIIKTDRLVGGDKGIVVPPPVKVSVDNNRHRGMVRNEVFLDQAMEITDALLACGATVQIDYDDDDDDDVQYIPNGLIAI